MIEGIDHISVRIYRYEGEDIVLRGTGTLFEDNGHYYVLTAHHCLEKETPDGTQIDFDLSKTRISFFHEDKEVDVPIHLDAGIPKDKERDWAIISVKKPVVGWDFDGKLKFSVSREADKTYESFPYPWSYKGEGRFVKLQSTNQRGAYHICDEIAGGRFAADTVMKGGSGAGVIRAKDNIMYCFGLLKETLEDGAFNDVVTVLPEAFLPYLSSQAEKKFTKLELAKWNQMDADEMKQQILQMLQTGQGDEGKRTLVVQLLTETIPAMLDNFEAGLASGVLDCISANCETLLADEKELDASYHYCLAQCHVINGETGAARQLYQEAYALDSQKEELIEHEVHRLLRLDDKEGAREVALRLPVSNQVRTGLEVLMSADQKACFEELSDNLKTSKTFRYRVIELSSYFKIDITWIIDERLAEAPETLTLSNLPEWLYVLTYYRVALRDYIILHKIENYEPDALYVNAFFVAKRFFELAERANQAMHYPIVYALYCYWGYLVEDDEQWIDRFAKIDRREAGDQAMFVAMLNAALLSMTGRYDEAYYLLNSERSEADDTRLQFVVKLSGVSGKSAYIKQTLSEKRRVPLILTPVVAESICDLAAALSTADYLKVLSMCRFERDSDRWLLHDIASMKEGQTVDVGKYSDEILRGYERSMAASAAQLLSYAGKTEYALHYLETKYVPGQYDIVGQTYMILMQKIGGYRPKLYGELHNMRLSGQKMEYNQLATEYNYSLQLGDYDNALDVVTIIWQQNHENEWALAGMIDLLGRTKPEKLQEYIDTIMDYHFLRVGHIKAVYLALANNHYDKEAAEFLYQNTINRHEAALSAYYDQEVIMGRMARIANEGFESAADGRYVLYEILKDGKRICRQMDSGAVIDRALIGHRKDEEVEVTVSGEVKRLKIIGIFNKYYYLHYLNMREVMESGGNEYFTPFTINTDAEDHGVKELLNILEKMGGGDKRKSAIDQYQKGGLALIQMLDNEDVVGCYYQYLFSKFKLQMNSYHYYHRKGIDLKDEKVEFVLDFTSLLLLFEYSLVNNGQTYQRKFLIPKLIVDIIKEYRKNMPYIHSAAMLDAQQQGKIVRLSDRLDLDAEERIDLLIAWMRDNCTEVASTAVLKIDVPQSTPLTELFRHVMVEVLPEEGGRRILLSEDAHLEDIMKASLPMVSTETYMRDVEGLRRSETFAEFLCNNSCIGAMIPSLYIYDQYFHLEAKEENNIPDVIETLRKSCDIDGCMKACLDILRDAYNMDLAKMTVRSFLEAVLSSFKDGLFEMEEWKQMVDGLRRTIEGRDVIVPMIEEIIENRKNIK